MTDQSLLSAQVVLRSRSGKSAGPTDRVTSSNVGDFEPSPDTVAQAAEGFRKLGFSVGAVVGSSFAITADAATFERVFKRDLTHVTKRAAGAKTRSRTDTNELPLKQLPNALASLVTAVTFTPPPDFGPGSFA